MDEGDRDFINRLFAAATEMLEDALEVTVAGQSSRLSATRLVAHGIHLRAAAREIASIAEAAIIMANASRKPRSKNGGSGP